MVPWPPAQNESERLRTCVEGLAHDVLARGVDVFGK